VVLANAALALVAADKTDSLREGARMAAESIDSGAALEKLNMLVKYSRELAGTEE